LPCSGAAHTNGIDYPLLFEIELEGEIDQVLSGYLFFLLCQNLFMNDNRSCGYSLP